MRAEAFQRRVRATWRGVCFPLNGRRGSLWKASAHEAAAPVLQPLAIGAPAPLRELPVRLERMIHFVPPHVEKVRAKVPELLRQVDVVLGNLEDAIPADAKEAARAGFIAMAQARSISARPACGRGSTRSTRPGRSTTSPRSSPRSATSSTSSCCRRSRAPWDIHYLDQLLAQLEAQHAHQEADPDPRHPGNRAGRQQCRGDRHRLAAHARHESRPRRSRRLARHEDHARRRRPSGLHGARRRQATARRAQQLQQDLWHYTLAKMVDACAAAGIKPFYGPFGDFSDPDGCEAQFRNAFLMGCAGAWSLHPIADRHRQAGVLARTRPRSRSPGKSSTPCRTAPARS